jgi:hypothetical protein
VAFSRDGRRIASSSDDRTVKVWDARTGQELLTLRGHPDKVNCVAFSSDGSRIISGTHDRTVKVWDTGTGKELLTLRGHTGSVQSVAVSADDSRIVSASWDRTVKVWDASTGMDLLTLGHFLPLSRVAISADGKRILGQDEKDKVLAWDAGSGQLLPDPPAGMPAGAGRTAASADRKVRVSIAGAGIRVRRADLEDVRKQREAHDRELLERLARFDPDWHRSRLDEALATGDDFAAAFHLERLLRVQPWDASLHVQQAHLLARLGKREQSAMHLAQALLLNRRVSLWPIDFGAARRGEQAAQASDWPRAAREFQIAAHQRQALPVCLTNLLLARCAAGDTAGIRQTMADLWQRVAGEKDATVAASLFSRAVAAPWDKADAAPLLAYTGRALRRQRYDVTLEDHGAALYRAGRYAEAEQILAEAVEARGLGGDSRTVLFQAMTVRQRGKRDEAAALLARVEAWHGKQKFATWQERVLWTTLLAEARKLIRTPPPMRKVGPED